MIEPLLFPEEQKRLESLRMLHLLDTPIEERFERITRMVCRLLDVPIALFNLIDEDRQHYKSAQGLTSTNAPLEAAFCTHAIHEKDMLLIPDATLDTRFHDNPFVSGEFLNIRFYAGCPVHTPDGMPIGTLCAIDMKPRSLTEDQLSTLRDLAVLVETELQVVKLSKIQDGLIRELDTAQRLALIDPLTRLWNRAGITTILEREWSEARRHETPVTLVMADIDNFKQINDTHGHAGGDEILRTLAKQMLETLRAEDAVGRVGGEEFLVILTKAAPSSVLETVDRIRKTVEGRIFRAGGKQVPVTMSFGVATATPSGDMKPEDLIRKADDALYASKKAGRNRVTIANS